MSADHDAQGDRLAKIEAALHKLTLLQLKQLTLLGTLLAQQLTARQMLGEVRDAQGAETAEQRAATDRFYRAAEELQSDALKDYLTAFDLVDLDVEDPYWARRAAPALTLLPETQPTHPSQPTPAHDPS